MNDKSVDDMKNNVPTGRFRIDFCVREILPVGQEQSEARCVAMGEDVDASMIKDYIDRCGNAAMLLFCGLAKPHVISFQRSPESPVRATLIHRRLTGSSLVDAVELINSPVGTPLIIFKDKKEALEAGREFGEFGMIVNVTPCNESTLGCKFTYNPQI